MSATVREALTALANAIRSKSGASGSMTIDEMTEAVNGISPGGGGMNVQAYHGMDSVRATSMTATAVKLTVAKTGTYKVSWMGARNTTSGTSQSQLYINGSAYGSAQGSFTNSYAQSVVLTGVSLTAGQEVVVRARARSTSYYMMVGNLVIEQTS